MLVNILERKDSMNTKEAKKLIENKLPEKRFKHSLRVA